MAGWRYAVNNLRRAVALLPEAQKQQHPSTLVYVQQIAESVAAFFAEPTAEALAAAAGNARQVFTLLRPWLAAAPPSEVPVAGLGLGWLPHSLRCGGATAQLLQLGALARTTIRGWWAGARTARLYINEAVALRATIVATSRQRARLAEAASHIPW